jgi:ATP-dependent Clp protease protease subunit
MSLKVSKDLLELHLKYLFEENVNLKTREILINSEINEDVFSMVDSAFSELESHSRKTITIKLCSGGGDETAALAIVGKMRSSKCKIVVEAFGTVASAATLILAAGHERRYSRFCQFMWHESSYTLEGRTTQLKVDIKEAERQEELWAQWMAEFSKKPKKFYLEQGRNTDKYWSPEQLLEYGVIDSII